MSTKLSDRLNPNQKGTRFKANQSLQRTKTPPISNITAQAITLGMAVSLASVPSLAKEKTSATLSTVEIEGQKIDDNPYAEQGAPYKANLSGDARRVKPLAETPQTIQVLTQQQLKDSGKNDLKEILQAQPGITIGTGEGGNMFGDRYIIRGHEARSDVFIDGMRDPGMTTRESFATEQVEISKGPSASFAGRGTTGGAVNSVTKQANLGRTFNKASAGIGTDEYRRYTFDTNQVLSDDMALRLNILEGYEGVPDRDPADRSRSGIAGSIFWVPTDKLDITLDHYHLKAEDGPDLGSYLDGANDWKPDNDFGAATQDEDFMDTEVDTTTLKLGYQATDNVRIENTTRVGKTTNAYVVTGVQGKDAIIWKNGTDLSDLSALTEDDIASTYRTVGDKSKAAAQKVDYMANALNTYIDAELGGMKHQFVLGLEYSDQDVTRYNTSVSSLGESNCYTSGRGGYSASKCFVGQDGKIVDNASSLLGKSVGGNSFHSQWESKTTSLGIMDTIDLTDNLTLHAGIRYDKFDLDLTANLADRGEPQNIDTVSYSEGLWNGHLGFVYKVAENGNVYASYGTASNVNGGESDVGTNASYGGLMLYTDPVTGEKKPVMEPENVTNIELGTKWELMDKKLLATAAVFQITKSDVLESATAAYDNNAAAPRGTGENQVRGIELGLAGNFTDKLSGQISATAMSSEITESVFSDNVGADLANFADKKINALLRYQTTPKLALGGGVTYSSQMTLGQPDTAAADYATVPSYTVVDLFANYRFNKDLDLQVNVGNVADTDYYLAAYRGGGAFAYKGDKRSIRATLNYEF